MAVSKESIYCHISCSVCFFPDPVASLKWCSLPNKSPMWSLYSSPHHHRDSYSGNRRVCQSTQTCSLLSVKLCPPQQSGFRWSYWNKSTKMVLIPFYRSNINLLADFSVAFWCHYVKWLLTRNNNLCFSSCNVRRDPSGSRRTWFPWQPLAFYGCSINW